MGKGLGGLLLAAALLSTPLRADWAGFSSYSVLAELAVNRSDANLVVRMPVTSLPGLAERLGESADANPDSLARKLMRVTDARGGSMREAGMRVTRDTAPAERSASTAEVVEINFQLISEEPISELTITPGQGIEGQIGLVILDRGVPLADLAPLNRRLGVHLDGDDPWKSATDDPSLIRSHAQPRSFLYVEPNEVRHELLLRLSDLKRWLPATLFERAQLAEADQPLVKEAIGKLLASHTRLLVDGQEARMESAVIQFVAFTRTGVQPLPAGPVDVKAALVGAVMSAPLQRPTGNISLAWDLFSDKSSPWPVSILDGAETFDTYVTSQQSRLDWSREDGFEPVKNGEATTQEDETLVPATAKDPNQPESDRRLTTLLALLLPVGAWFLWLLNPRRRFSGLALAGALAIGVAFSCYPGIQNSQSVRAMQLDETRLRALLPPLLHNAYRGFQETNEEAAYDRLARSLDDELLEETYLQQRRALLRQAKGLGGLGKVERVEIEQLKLLPQDNSAGTTVEAAWIAHGSVSHWGHSHPRHNRYRASLTLRLKQDRRVRITNMEFLDGQTLGSGPAT